MSNENKEQRPLEQDLQHMTPHQLMKEADNLLKQAGYGMFGEERKDTNDAVRHSLFNKRMQGGAYSRSSERRKY